MLFCAALELKIAEKSFWIIVVALVLKPINRLRLQPEFVGIGVQSPKPNV